MNKLILNTITAALLPLSMQSVSAQPAGAYSYIGNRNSNAVSKPLVHTPFVNKKHTKAKQVTSVQTLMQAPTVIDDLVLLDLSQQNIEHPQNFDISQNTVASRSAGSAKVTVLTKPDLQLTTHTPINELIIIDGAVPDKHLFYQQLKPGTDIVEIDSQQSGLSQLKEILSGYSELSALHLVSHATDGVILLGDSRIDEQLLKDEVKTLAAIDNALKDGADVLIYGCDLAKGDSGQQLLETIAHTANVDVAASDDLTGSNNKNADWDLEIKIGDIDSSLVFSERSLLDFTETLAVTEYTSLAIYTYSYDNGNDFNQSSLATSDGNFIATNTGGNISASGASSIGYLYAGVGTGLYGKTLQVAADGTNTVTFELHTLNLSAAKAEGCDGTVAVDVTVEGYYSNGSSAGAQNATIDTEPAFCSGNDVDIVDVSSTFGAGKDLSHFVVKYNGTAPADKYYTITSFSVDNLKAPTSNTAPTLTSLSTTYTVTEDVASAIDLSAATFSDAEGDSLTVTLAVNSGTIASIDGDGVTDSVTVANSGASSMTIAGSIANIHTYLDTVNKIEVTTATNSITDITLTLTPNDGALSGASVTSTLSVTPVNDAPTVSIGANQTVGGVCVFS
jgi:hypothetical protein